MSIKKEEDIHKPDSRDGCIIKAELSEASHRREQTQIFGLIKFISERYLKSSLFSAHMGS